eukprot:g81951.t1
MLLLIFIQNTFSTSIRSSIVLGKIWVAKARSILNRTSPAPFSLHVLMSAVLFLLQPCCHTGLTHVFDIGMFAALWEVATKALIGAEATRQEETQKIETAEQELRDKHPRTRRPSNLTKGIEGKSAPIEDKQRHQVPSISEADFLSSNRGTQHSIESSSRSRTHNKNTFGTSDSPSSSHGDDNGNNYHLGAAVYNSGGDKERPNSSGTMSTESQPRPPQTNQRSMNARAAAESTNYSDNSSNFSGGDEDSHNNNGYDQSRHEYHPRSSKTTQLPVSATVRTEGSTETAQLPVSATVGTESTTYSGGGYSENGSHGADNSFGRTGPDCPPRPAIARATNESTSYGDGDYNVTDSSRLDYQPTPPETCQPPLNAGVSSSSKSNYPYSDGQTYSQNRLHSQPRPPETSELPVNAWTTKNATYSGGAYSHGSPGHGSAGRTTRSSTELKNTPSHTGPMTKIVFYAALSSKLPSGSLAVVCGRERIDLKWMNQITNRYVYLYASGLVTLPVGHEYFYQYTESAAFYRSSRIRLEERYRKIPSAHFQFDDDVFPIEQKRYQKYEQRRNRAMLYLALVEDAASRPGWPEQVKIAATWKEMEVVRDAVSWLFQNPNWKLKPEQAILLVILLSRTHEYQVTARHASNILRSIAMAESWMVDEVKPYSKFTTTGVIRLFDTVDKSFDHWRLKLDNFFMLCPNMRFFDIDIFPEVPGKKAQETFKKFVSESQTIMAELDDNSFLSVARVLVTRAPTVACVVELLTLLGQSPNNRSISLSRVPFSQRIFQLKDQIKNVRHLQQLVQMVPDPSRSLVWPAFSNIFECLGSTYIEWQIFRWFYSLPDFFDGRENRAKVIESFLKHCPAQKMPGDFPDFLAQNVACELTQTQAEKLAWSWMMASVQWEQEDSVFQAYQKLHALSKVDENLLVRLHANLQQRFQQYDPGRILGAASRVGEVADEKLQNLYLGVLTALGILQAKSVSHLKRIVTLVCGEGKTSTFNIPNRLCDEIVRVILDGLPFLNVNIGSSSFHALLQGDNAIFWADILGATGVTTKTLASDKAKEAQAAIQKMKNSFLTDTVDGGKVSDLAEFSKPLLRFFNINQPHMGADVLEKQFLCMETFKQTLAHLCVFISKYCSTAIDFEKYQKLKDQTKATWPTLPIRQLFADDFWGELSALVDTAKLVASRTSKSFDNYFKRELETAEAPTVEHITSRLVAQALHAYEKAVKFLWTSKPDELTLERVQVLLIGVSVSSVEQEVQQMRGFFSLPIIDAYTLELLLGAARFASTDDVCKNLLELVKIFEGKTNLKPGPLFGHIKDFQERKAASTVVHLKKIQDSIPGIFYESSLVLCEMSQAAELIDFLKTAPDDLTQFIDGAEEQDSQLQKHSISEMITAQKLFRPLLSTQYRDTDSLLDDIASNLRRPEFSEDKQLSAKLSSANNTVFDFRQVSLKISDRGALTKQLIKHAVETGTFCFFCLEGELCNAVLEYKVKRQDTTKIETLAFDGILDLRGRALLRVSSVSESSEDSEDDIFKSFIEQTDLLQQLQELISAFCRSGHPDMPKFDQEFQRRVKGGDMAACFKEIKAKYDDWQKDLVELRRSQPFLNFFNSRQVGLLCQYFCGDIDIKIQKPRVLMCHDLLRFLDPSVKLQSMEKLRGRISSQEPVMKRLKQLEERVLRTFVKNKSKSQPENLAPREILVTPVPSEDRSLRVLMSLFMKSTKRVPSAHQLLFCSLETSWDEVLVFLLRCMHSAEYDMQNEIFCIVGSEALDFHLQVRLCQFVAHDMESKQGFRLAILCRSDVQQYILQTLADFKHESEVSFQELQGFIQTSFPEVLVVVSERPSLGKSHFIKCHAAEHKLCPVTFPIGGHVNIAALVRSLHNVDIRPFNCLHLDITQVDNPARLDQFLFQLVILGSVSSGVNQFIHINKRVYIEIANSLAGSLDGSLRTTLLFKRQNMLWSSNSIIVSELAESPVQLVCRYLQSLKSGSCETKDIEVEPKDFVPLSNHQCIALLDEYFFQRGKKSGLELSFALMHSFINSFSLQLMYFSQSDFFCTQNLLYMTSVNKAKAVRRILLQSLLDVSFEYATRSVSSSKVTQTQELMESREPNADAMLQRIAGMVQFENSNHLVVMFNSSDRSTVSVLYRDHKQVQATKPEIQELFATQSLEEDFKLPDFPSMSQDDLVVVLKRICSTGSEENIDLDSYVITADNLLKMGLIMVRVNARIPVVVMGETGCGVSRADLEDFVDKLEAKAQEGPVWGFLDEINTCDHLGFITDILAHRVFKGRTLHPQVALLAACNPYRRRTKQVSVGLAHEASTLDEMAKLVYRVHPLPETLLEYVWDYGSLSKMDERSYIAKLVRGHAYALLLTELFVHSQQFIRLLDIHGELGEHKDGTPMISSTVSLRDVVRAFRLIHFFEKDQQLKFGDGDPERKDNLLKDKTTIAIHSIVLALAHCYHSRLGDVSQRLKYRALVANCFKAHDARRFRDMTADSIRIILQTEQKDILRRMEGGIPSATALNEALLENVFVIFVCILNKIPVFVVGKPGCSKSLSMRLIRDNLRGPGSRDWYFRKLPHVYVVSYQGSQSSTSEGIQKVFKKAQDYVEPGVLPVVLLDEVGLAEISKNNPLKVLHSLLEPGTKHHLPDVGVVGISNWHLDSAKMNRAIHLARPEPDIDSLVETAMAIYENYQQESEPRRRQSSAPTHQEDSKLRPLAEAYFTYRDSQLKNQTEGLRHFHGLRDFYSMAKCCARDMLSANKDNDDSALLQSLERNFGGLLENGQSSSWTVQKIFLEKTGVGKQPLQSSVPDLIKANVQDQEARHLLLVVDTDSSIGLLQAILSDIKIKPIVMYGSRFLEDRDSPQYIYQILNKIILYMSFGKTIILKDLDTVYGSLYDMLNQSYSYTGKQRNCRVALGAHNNPICRVHKDFRCIVLWNRDRLKEADPPFLNRFEKQVLSYSDLLKANLDPLRKLQEWAKSISHIYCKGELVFTEIDMFVGCHHNTLPSLILRLRDTLSDEDDLLKKCKETIMLTATADGVVRGIDSALGRVSRWEVNSLREEYFQQNYRQNLLSFLEAALSGKVPDLDSKVGFKSIVMTFSSLATRLDSITQGSDLLPRGSSQIDQLGQFKSETRLAERVGNFFKSNMSLLLLQCDVELDSDSILLSKFLIESALLDYQRSNLTSPKHVCLLLHVPRLGKALQHEDWQFDFLCGWPQFTVESLEPMKIPLEILVKKNVSEIISSEIYPFEAVFRDVLIACSTNLKYPKHLKADQFKQVLLNLRGLLGLDETATAFVVALKSKCVEWVKEAEKKGDSSWDLQVASDRPKVLMASTLQNALLQEVRAIVSRPISMCLFFLESSSALTSYCTDFAPVRTLWLKLFEESYTAATKEMSSQVGAHCFEIGEYFLDLRFPFSLPLIRYLESLRNQFEQDVAAPDNIDKETGGVREDFVQYEIKRLKAKAAQENPLYKHFVSYLSAYAEVAQPLKSSALSKAALSSQEGQEGLASVGDLSFLSVGDSSILSLRNSSLPSDGSAELKGLVPEDSSAEMKEPAPDSDDDSPEEKEPADDDSVEKKESVGEANGISRLVTLYFEDFLKVILAAYELDVDTAKHAMAIVSFYVNWNHVRDLVDVHTWWWTSSNSVSAVLDLVFTCKNIVPPKDVAGILTDSKQGDVHEMLISLYCESLLPRQQVMARYGQDAAGLLKWHHDSIILLSKLVSLDDSDVQQPALALLKILNDFCNVLLIPLNEGPARLVCIATKMSALPKDKYFRSRVLYDAVMQELSQLDPKLIPRFVSLFCVRCMDATPKVDEDQPVQEEENMVVHPPECDVCLEPYATEGDHVPLVLAQCGHSLCRACVDDSVKEDAKTVKCAKDYQDSPVPLKKNFVLIEMIQKSHEAVTRRMEDKKDLRECLLDKVFSFSDPPAFINEVLERILEEADLAGAFCDNTFALNSMLKTIQDKLAQAQNAKLIVACVDIIQAQSKEHFQNGLASLAQSEQSDDELQRVERALYIVGAEDGEHQLLVRLSAVAYVRNLLELYSLHMKQEGGLLPAAIEAVEAKLVEDSPVAEILRVFVLKQWQLPLQQIRAHAEPLETKWLQKLDWKPSSTHKWTYNPFRVCETEPDAYDRLYGLLMQAFNQSTAIGAVIEAMQDARDGPALCRLLRVFAQVYYLPLATVEGWIIRHRPTSDAILDSKAYSILEPATKALLAGVLQGFSETSPFTTDLNDAYGLYVSSVLIHLSILLSTSNDVEQPLVAVFRQGLTDFMPAGLGEAEGYQPLPDNRSKIRNLSPVAFAILDFFVHSTLVCARALHAWKADWFDDKLFESCRHRLRSRYDTIANSLDLDGDETCLLLHGVVSGFNALPTGRLRSPADLQAWENAFQHNVLTLTSEPHAATRDMFISESSIDQKHELELQLTEQKQVQHPLQILFRRVRPKSIENLRAYFYGGSNFTAFPFLRLYFEHESKFTFLKALYPLVKCIRWVYARFSNRITEEKARNVKIVGYLQQKAEKDLFDNFDDAWKILQDNMKLLCRVDFKELTLPAILPDMSRDSVLINFCFQTPQKSSILFTMITAMMEIHNQFLMEVYALAERDPNAYGFIKATKAISLFKLKAEHVVDDVWDPSILNHGLQSPAFGSGRSISYSLPRIELILFQKTLSQRGIIENKVPILPFKENFQEAISRILEDIVAHVSQQMVEAKEVQQVKPSASLAESFGMVLTFVARTRGLPETSLNAYCEHYFNFKDQPEIKDFCDHFGRFPLSKVVGIYEIMEEKSFDLFADAVDPIYKLGLGPENEAKLSKCLDFIPARLALIAVSRIIVRNLKSSNLSPDLHFCEFLSKEGAWRSFDVSLKTSLKPEDLTSKFPQALQLKHAHAIREYLVKVEKMKQPITSAQRRTIQPAVAAAAGPCPAANLTLYSDMLLTVHIPKRHKICHTNIHHYLRCKNVWLTIKHFISYPNKWFKSVLKNHEQQKRHWKLITSFPCLLSYVHYYLTLTRLLQDPQFCRYSLYNHLHICGSSFNFNINTNF